MVVIEVVLVVVKIVLIVIEVVVQTSYLIVISFVRDYLKESIIEGYFEPSTITLDYC